MQQNSKRTSKDASHDELASDAPVTDGPSIPEDWMRADLRGEQRDLTWYVARAQQGDQKAALRALALCEASLTETALAQNGWRMSNLLATALRAVLAGTSENGDSTLLRVARGKRGGRGPIERDRWAKWWLCYDMHRLLRNDDSLTAEAAAAAVLSAPDTAFSIEPDSLAREYRSRQQEMIAEFDRSEAAEGERDSRKKPRERPADK